MIPVTSSWADALRTYCGPEQEPGEGGVFESSEQSCQSKLESMHGLRGLLADLHRCADCDGIFSQPLHFRNRDDHAMFM